MIESGPRPRRRRALRVLAWIALALVVLGAVAAFVMFAPPFHLAERFARPEFCASCHNMQPELQAMRSSVHADLGSCNDCHLPNDDAVSHFFWDGVFGTRDLIEFYGLGRAPYDARATGLSRRIIENNCRRCHSDVVRHVDVSGRQCWDCHRVMYHRKQLAVDRLQGGEGNAQ
jgi:cytochrome c nitrite reductase small subunit